jgi:hypothetical protein
MTNHYDVIETRKPAEREADLFSRLPGVLRKAMTAPAYAERLKGINPAGIASRTALARLPVLRKSDLPALHRASPPFGGFVSGHPGSFGRLFTSPGPIFEPEPVHADPWRGARALFAAGFRPSDVVLNTFSYHLTPGGFICLRARARLRGYPRRSRQHRSAIRADRSVSPGRLQRHARFPQNPARRGCRRRARYLLDQARAGVRSCVSEIAAGGDQVARH